jgi:16S rRNA (guanine527-N7)-methyltransferase
VEDPDRALLSATATRFGVELAPAAIDRIGRFLDELDRWNPRLRLTGERDRATLLRRHVVDSLACAPLIRLGGRVLDVGTGAGFPGVVLACARPDAEVTLLDARQRPVSFLGEVIRNVPLDRASALAMRAEDAASDRALAGQFHVVTCRALRMAVFLRLAKPFLAPGGVAVSMQVPKVSRPESAAAAAAAGLNLVELRDYALPDGDPRRLVVCA